MRLNPRFLPAILLLYSLTGCELFDRFHDEKPRHTQITEFAADLQHPIGIETDSKKQLWVTQVGTGQGNTGQVSLITPQGEVYPVVTGFASGIFAGEIYGLSNLVLQDGILWLLHGLQGRLYRFNINDFAIGDEPVDASELAYEDIGAFVLAYDFEEDTGESNPFNLTVGPAGDLFIVDAGANAIIRRQAGTGALSVFATFPGLPNPTQVGPPTIDPVPTGIVYDGKKFLVSSLTGFPFLAGLANVYQVDQAGNVSVYQRGFTTLTDIEWGQYHQPLVLQLGTFSPEAGFAPRSGRLVAANKNKISPIVTELNLPTAIKKSDAKTYYLSSSQEGKIYKLVYH